MGRFRTPIEGNCEGLQCSDLPGEAEEFVPCGRESVDCTWGEWGPWQSCTNRQKSIRQRRALHHGQHCGEKCKVRRNHIGGRK